MGILESLAEIKRNIKQQIAYIYIKRGEKRLKANNNKKALEFFIKARGLTSVRGNIPLYNHVRNKIGITYSRLAGNAGKDTRKAYLEKAISAYESALKLCTPEEHPYDYFQINSNLANAFGALAAEKKMERYLNRARDAFQRAKSIKDLHVEPLEKAILYHGLGNINMLLAECHEDGRYIDEAIGNFETALESVNEKKHPDEYSDMSASLKRAKEAREDY